MLRVSFFSENVVRGKNGYGIDYVNRMLDGILQSTGGQCVFWLVQTPYSWVAVDLGDKYVISHGRILSRGDTC